MKSILMISHSSNKTGGGEDDFQRLLEYFKSKCYVIYSVFPEGSRAEYFKSLSNHSIILPDNMFPYTGINLKKYIFFIYYAFKKIIVLLPFLNNAKKKVDIGFVNSSVCIPEILLLNILGIPYVLSMKEIINPPIIRHIIYRYFNCTAKHVIVISNFLKNIVSDYLFIPKISIIRSSIDETLCRKIRENEVIFKNNELIISNLGVITPMKNQMLLVESLKNVKCNKLVIVNIIGRIEDEIYFQKLKDTVNEINLSNITVNFIGEVSRNIALEYIASSNIIINTSFFEGMSLVIAEALFFQKPIISTKTGIAEEVIEENINGFLIDKYNTIELSSLINMLVNNEVILKTISENQSNTYCKYFNTNYYFSEHERILLND